MEKWTKNKVITSTILFTLLGARISLSIIALIYSGFLKMGSVPVWVAQLGKSAPWINAIYMASAFVMIAIFILVNQDNLQRLNIGKFYIILFIYSGFAILVEYIYAFGFMTGIAAVLFTVYVLWKKNLDFGDSNPLARKISLLSVLIFAICIVVFGSFITKTTGVGQYVKFFFLDTIPASVYEEAIYRGILWMYLRDLKWGESKIFVFQSLLFWGSHIDFIIRSPFSFWVFTPGISFLLGYIVLRTKSITPSTIAHLLTNFLYGLIQVAL